LVTLTWTHICHFFRRCCWKNVFFFLGLFKGAGKALKHGGHLITYGPYKIDGVLSPQSNVVFDQSLQQRNPEWGIRELNDCKNLACQNQLTFVKKISMPANNFVVIYIKN
jgi:hypothetical protein